MINSMLGNYIILFTVINIVELAMGVFMFFVPDKKGVQEYLVCLYGGFFFGAIPFYLLFDTGVAVITGCIVLSIIFICINYFWTKKVIPIGVILFKIILILGSTLSEEYYSADRLGFCIKAMLLSMLILFGINLLYDLSEKNKRILITGLFGVLELGGAIIVQFYNVDYTRFDKDFFGKRESVSLSLCLLKVDFWIFNYQYLFLFIIICFVITIFCLEKNSIQVHCISTKT